MKPLEERLAEYLKKNPKKLMGRGVAPQALQRTAERFANMAELAANNAIPTTGSITAEASAVKIDGTTAMFTVDYDHDTAMRDSFLPDPKNPYYSSGQADLLYLFNNGWEYDDANAPYGEWRGMRVRAVSTRAGSHFVQKVADVMEKAVPGCTVQINPAYGVRERGGEQE